MKFLPFFVLIFSTCIFAQENPVCPSIQVSSPLVETSPGEMMKFSVLLDELIDEELKLKYKWSTDKGRIVTNPNDAIIEIGETEYFKGEVISAKLEIHGLPENCENNFFGEGAVKAAPKGEAIDEFGNLSSDEMMNRLDNFFVRLQNEPTSTGYIVVYGDSGDATDHQQFIHQHIESREAHTLSIFMVNQREEGDVRTVLWIVPAGAVFPQL